MTQESLTSQIMEMVGSANISQNVVEFQYSVLHIDGGLAAWKSAGLPIEE